LGGDSSFCSFSFFGGRHGAFGSGVCPFPFLSKGSPGIWWLRTLKLLLLPHPLSILPLASLLLLSMDPQYIQLLGWPLVFWLPCVLLSLARRESCTLFEALL
jgi:hypothetical protein